MYYNRSSIRAEFFLNSGETLRRMKIDESIGLILNPIETLAMRCEEQCHGSNGNWAIDC